MNNGVKVRPSNCLVCNKKLDGAMSPEGARVPKPNDVSVCAYCGNIALYDDSLRLRQPTEEEKQEVIDNLLPHQRVMLTAMQEHFSRKGIKSTNG